MSTHRTPHYFLRIARPLAADEWFRVIRGVRDRLAALGYEVREFNDSYDGDREWRRTAGALDWFEGQVVFPPDERWKQALIQSFRDEGERPVAADLDDQPYEVASR